MNAPENKAEIRRLIPHSGNMCLLDKVISWDQTQIQCASISHHDIGNPLRIKGKLLAVHLIEYGAQAMAIHAGLLAKAHRQVLKPGYLAAIHQAKFYIDQVDQDIAELVVFASLQIRSDAGAVYTIAIHGQNGKQRLVEARATVMHIP